jgi:hypothetical protein
MVEPIFELRDLGTQVVVLVDKLGIGFAILRHADSPNDEINSIQVRSNEKSRN